MPVLALILMLSFTGPAAEPLEEKALASFQGKVKAFTSKKISMELPDENILDFHCSRKTKYFLGGKPSDAKKLKAGETIVVEAERAIDGSLDAINVRMEKPQ